MRFFHSHIPLLGSKLVQAETRDTSFGHTKTRVFIFCFVQGVTSYPDDIFIKTKDDDKYIILCYGRRMRIMVVVKQKEGFVFNIFHILGGGGGGGGGGVRKRITEQMAFL